MAIQNPNIPASAYTGQSTQIQPSLGSRLYEDDSGAIDIAGATSRSSKGFAAPWRHEFRHARPPRH